MAKDAHELAAEWDRCTENSPLEKDGYDDFTSIFKTIEFLEEELYRQYDPTRFPPYLDYFPRLRDWLANTNDENAQRILFELAPRLTFLGNEEFATLYQSSFNGPTTRWVLDLLDIKLDDPNLDGKLSSELHQHTWYCPITDSMDISAFYHVNGIGGIDHRPDFRSLRKFGDKEKILSHIRDHKNAREEPTPLRRLVLLEDFVGSGDQCEKTLKFAAALDSNIPVLFIPLVICPAGAQRIRKMIATGGYPNLRCEPALELTEDGFINDKVNLDPDSLGANVRRLSKDVYCQVKGDDSPPPLPYTEFGFQHTGSTVVLHSNTPDNTLPIIHHTSNTWKPLFPRSARVK